MSKAHHVVVLEPQFSYTYESGSWREWRIECSCGWKEKSYSQEVARSRWKRHLPTLEAAFYVLAD